MDIRRYTMEDAPKLAELWRRPEVWPNLIDDHTRNADAGAIVKWYLSNPVAIVIGSDPDENCFIFVPFGGMTVAEAHIVLSPTMKHRVRSAYDVATWLFRYTQYRAVAALVPLHKGKRSVVAAYARGCGMKRVGVMPESFLYNGAMLDIALYHGTVNDYRKLRRKKICHL